MTVGVTEASSVGVTCEAHLADSADTAPFYLWNFTLSGLAVKAVGSAVPTGPQIPGPFGDLHNCAGDC